MGKPRRWNRLDPDAVLAVIRSAPSTSAAARELGVDRTTVYRWQVGGKVPKPGTQAPRRRVAPAGGIADPAPAVPDAPGAAWAARVRGLFEFSSTEDAMVSLASEALDLARDVGQSPSVRLAAAKGFAALVRQLGGLEEPRAGVEGNTRPYVVA